MANDKKFVVKNGLTTQNIAFVDDITNANNTIDVSMLNTDTLSFSGNSGQLFSITDTLSGTIFSVNDISGIPSIEVDDDGTIRLAEFAGNVLIGTATDNGTDLLQVDGSVSATTFTGALSGNATTASSLQTARTISLGGVLSGSASFDGSSNITITAAHTSDPVITLTGAVTGSGTMTNLGNVSIATTATADPTLTLTGDVTGTATFTNLGNATLTATVANDSHTHDGRYYTESESDSRFVNVTGDTMSSDLIINSIGANNNAAAIDNIKVSGYGIVGNRGTFYVTNNGTVQIGVGGTHNADSAMTFTSTQNTSLKTLYENTNRVFNDGYHPNADKLTTARNIALTGAVTGNANFDGSDNISIATTATADPTLTINGDASGSATFTNLGNATLTLTIADDSHNHVISNVDGLQTALDAKAPLANPALSGTPTAPTASSGTNTTQIATTAFVSSAVSDLVNSAPGTLDTLNELAAALGDDPNFATTVSTQIGTKADKTITISTGSGLAGGGDLSANRTISHADTSSQASVNNSNGTVIQDITLDGFGHITALGSLNLDTRYYESAYGGLYTTKSASEVGYTASSLSGRFSHLRGGLGVANVTFAQALADATSKGVRLPTVDEIEDEIVRGTGGGFDSQICWTCTPVPGRPGFVYAKLGTGAGTREEYPTDGTQTAYTRYVANVDVPTPPKADTLTTARTISLGGDLSGSASFDGSSNITITAAIADDSHNHTIANVDGLQTALDDKLSTTGKAADSNLLDGINSTAFLRSNVNDTFTNLTGTSLTIGAGVTLAESTDRADLLQITSNTSTFGGLQIRNSSNEGRWSFMTDGGTAGIYDDENGDWAIQMLENSEVRLYFNGSEKLNTTSTGITVTGDVNSTSDRNLKKDIVKIDNALEKVQSINGYLFTYKDTNQKSVGVIAQEVEEVLPEVVNGEEGHKTVSYGNMVGLLIEAIKEQQKEINELKSYINNNS